MRDLGNVPVADRLVRQISALVTQTSPSLKPTALQGSRLAESAGHLAAFTLKMSDRHEPKVGAYVSVVGT